MTTHQATPHTAAHDHHQQAHRPISEPGPPRGPRPRTGRAPAT